MSNIFVYAIEVCKWGTDDVVKTLYFIGQTAFEVNHIANHYIYEESEEFNSFPVQVTGIQKVKNLGPIVNGAEYFVDDEDEGEGYTGKEPLTMAENMPDERVLKFKCSCKEEIRAADGDWPFLICPNCENRILRREITDVGGYVIYAPLDKDKKK